jgi:two-component system alkaline phosphatase synthesis response regulator PhoP
MAKKILVVDDEPDILKLTSLRLKLSGYEVLTATNGQDALDLIRQQRPDLVLLDSLLPLVGGSNISGSDVCEKVKKDEQLKQTRIILFTARSNSMTARRAKLLGADDYMTKPFDAEELLKKIKQTLESNSASSDNPVLPVPSTSAS